MHKGLEAISRGVGGSAAWVSWVIPWVTPLPATTSIVSCPLWHIITTILGDIKANNVRLY